MFFRNANYGARYQTVNNMKYLSVSWRNVLVVKLLEKNLGHSIIKSKLESIWKNMVGIELMNVSHTFYMLKFDWEEGENKVIIRWSWVICDHYLVVGQWTPSCIHYKDHHNHGVGKNSHHQPCFLWRKYFVGFYLIGRQFLHTCVKFDLAKLVICRVGMNLEWYQVQYVGTRNLYAPRMLRPCDERLPSFKR